MSEAMPKVGNEAWHFGTPTMADEQETFENVGAGASKTTPQQAGTLKKNGFVVIKGHPCKIVDYSTSKTGKHGHAKANIVGVDIFTGKKYEDICPTSHNMEVPVIKRSEWQLVDISHDGYLTLMSKDGSDQREDLKLPEGELGEQIKTAFDDGKDLLLSVVAAMDQEGVLGMKEMST
jgi:translation initiation factor 5A